MIPRHKNFSFVRAGGNIPNFYLPDACFGYIDKYGARWLLHHFADGTLDMPHLRRAMIAVKTTWKKHPDYRKILAHLERHLNLYKERRPNTSKEVKSD